MHLFLLIIFGLLVSAFAQKVPMVDEISYTNDIRPVIENFCTTCHAGDEPEGDLTLTTYHEVRNHVEKGDILERINNPNEPMPERGLMPLYIRRLFKLWADKGYVNKGTMKKKSAMKKYADFKAPKINPIDISKQGFEFLEKMQGHWVGTMDLMGNHFEWFTLDYRAIAPSHVHGIFEGGTMGNLFTSFFVTDFKGKRTLMARNGGILNGIYRTSYFVLDTVKKTSKGDYYRFVDAYGGVQIMSIEVYFKKTFMEFNSYTSRFGLFSPKLHMSFKAKRHDDEMMNASAKAVGFPKNIVSLDMSKGLPEPNWGDDETPITSASYMWQEAGMSLRQLAKAAKDPYSIDDLPYLSELKVSIDRKLKLKGKKLFIYLSKKSLTDKKGRFVMAHGFVREKLLNGLMHFPEISSKQTSFNFTYLHPGEYYITIVADNGDFVPGVGDWSLVSKKVIVKPKSKQTVNFVNEAVLN
ncbi:MAG: hypothetical protein NE330_10235 [Lentisphaeraceae bacterium]|nr:hypothetical protein [Lentisphaeraceae bacterium]